MWPDGVGVSVPILDQDLGLAQQSDDLLRRVILPWQFLAPWKLEIVGSPTLKVGKLQAEEYVRDRKLAPAIRCRQSASA